MRKGPSFAHNRNMPSKNITKQYAPQSYYHIYSRGVAKQPIFNEEEDYAVFVSLFKRYLSQENKKNISRHLYPTYKSRLDLLSYCLMPNHLHLLVYQKDEKAITEFMRALLTSYSMYFNKTNRRVGPVFQSRYKARLIEDQTYLEHISRYIHLNPNNWENSNKTSVDFYLNKRRADWVKPERILEVFDNNKEKYLEFLKDYEDHKQTLDELRWELADTWR